jgi:hypothetical protein
MVYNFFKASMKKLTDMKYFIPVPLTIIYSCNTDENKKQQKSNTQAQDYIRILVTEKGDAINLIGGYEVIDTANGYILFLLQIKVENDKEESAIGFSKRSGEGNMYWNTVFPKL